MSARHQVRRPDRSSKERAPSKAGPAEEQVSSIGAGPKRSAISPASGRQGSDAFRLGSLRTLQAFFLRPKARKVKSAPDVFADALVPGRKACHVAVGRIHLPNMVVALSPRFDGDGYRFATWQGKAIFADTKKVPINRGLSSITAPRKLEAFTTDSSRYLNCPSNLIRQDHPNRPASGLEDNGTFCKRTGAALGRAPV